VLEVHLGLGGKGIGQRIDEMLQRENKVADCASSSTSSTTSRVAKTERLDHLSDDEILEMAGNLSNGVPFATPVSMALPSRRSAACCSSLSGRDRQGQGL
jgi:DNA-directed RNA polymerase subunit beta